MTSDGIGGNRFSPISLYIKVIKERNRDNEYLYQKFLLNKWLPNQTAFSENGMKERLPMYSFPSTLISGVGSFSSLYNSHLSKNSIIVNLIKNPNPSIIRKKIATAISIINSSSRKLSSQQMDYLTLFISPFGSTLSVPCSQFLFFPIQ